MHRPRPLVSIATLLVCLLLAAPLPAQTLTVLHEFGAPGDGFEPTSPLLFDAAGNLYGTTAEGPDRTHCFNLGCGTVFQLKPQSDGTWSESVLFAFGGSTGVDPAGVIFDGAGDLFGTTRCDEDQDYCYHAGAVYELSPNPDGTWTETTLHHFSAPWDGGEPNALVFDAAGNLDGVTYYGGLNNTGTVYTLNRANQWSERLDYVFGNVEANMDGAYPGPVIALDGSGNLYGATSLGPGVNGSGIVFEVMATNSRVLWPRKILYAFTGGADGYYPNGVSFGPDGNLYGTTQGGGTAGYGAVFQLTSNPDGSWTESVLYSFQGGTDGIEPTSGVIFDTAGNIYGTTVGGGQGCEGFGCGVIYKLTRSGNGGWTETVLHRFDDTIDGAYPGGVILDSAGNLYGVAGVGGTYGQEGGIAYELTP